MVTVIDGRGNERKHEGASMFAQKNGHLELLTAKLEVVAIYAPGDWHEAHVGEPPPTEGEGPLVG